MKTVRAFPLFLIIVWFTGCAGIAPQTTAQKIAYAQATLTGLVNVTASLTETGKLSKTDALRLNEQLTEANESLKIARGLAAQGLPDNAIQRLQFVQKLLIEINAYLVNKQEGKI